MTATAGELPLQPDPVAPLTGNGVFLPVPPGAPPAHRPPRAPAGSGLPIVYFR